MDGTQQPLPETTGQIPDLEALANGTVRTDWTVEEVRALFELPFNDLLFAAQRAHRQHFDPNAVQISTLLSVKTGGCPEDCSYCPQSIRYETNVNNDPLMELDEVVAQASLAKSKGATRFCMGAAWRSPKPKQIEQINQMVKAVSDLGMETCATLGMLKPEQAEQLKDAGLDYYNHNLDTSERHYEKIIKVGTGASEFRSYRCLFTKRGVYKLGPAKISSVFPLGIMRGTAHIKEPIQIIVAPPIGTLSAHWEQRLRSSALGNEAVNRQLGNNEEEFYAIRGWRSGDNQRHIHWRSTAKRGKPMVRQFDQKSNRDLGLVLDLHAAGLNDPLAGTSRESSLALCETALSFAATILAQTQSTIKGTISVGISGAGSKIITDRHWHDLNNRVMRELALARAGSSNDLEPIIAQVARSVSSGTPIYVVSSRTQPDSILAAFGNTKFAKQIRWLKTDSDEFHRLFHMDRKSDQQQWEQLQERWVTHAED